MAVDSLKSLHDINSSVTREFMDVTMDDFVFRLTLFYPRQLQLLEVCCCISCS
jgi:hypothetical protein